MTGQEQKCDLNGGKLTVYGGTIEARGGDNMIVYAGQNPDDAKKHLFLDNRVPACYFRPYACVQEKK